MRTVPTCILGSADENPIVTGAHDPDKYVEVGSFTKVITGTILQQLAGQGVLTPDDPVERWLGVPPGTGITLRHLAEHTSGLPRLPPGTSRRDPYRTFTDDRLRERSCGLDLLAVAPAGQHQEYSNLGYAVLGAALAAASGQEYEELVAGLVLSPLGLPPHAMSATPPQHSRLLPTRWFGRTVKPWTMTGAVLPMRRPVGDSPHAGTRADGSRARSFTWRPGARMATHGAAARGLAQRSDRHGIRLQPAPSRTGAGPWYTV